jgi:hypothetical protein
MRSLWRFALDWARLSCLFLVCAALPACVSTPANYKPAGFNTKEEARAYVADHLYYAKKLTINEWDDFYRRFPEYWIDMQDAKKIGSTVEYHPWYTAYAFRWNTLRRKQSWDSNTVSRLANQSVQPGDDVFKVTFAMGPAARIVWDNDFEILAYSGKALIFENGLLSRIAVCNGCSVRHTQTSGLREGMLDSDVISVLGLKRPKY